MDSVSRPIASPSNTAWIPIAIYRIYGVHGEVVKLCSSNRLVIADLLGFAVIMSFAAV